MGNSLHNKIYLGRTPFYASRRMRVILALTLAASIGLAWLAVRSFK
ncbi:hypothetical protein [Massilia eurypsychrophila]|jgi:hypothetical protein|nr:hypothetical protein [Massilia eurypsychrophila]